MENPSDFSYLKVSLLTAQFSINVHNIIVIGHGYLSGVFDLVYVGPQRTFIAYLRADLGIN